MLKISIHVIGVQGHLIRSDLYYDIYIHCKYYTQYVCHREQSGQECPFDWCFLYLNVEKSKIEQGMNFFHEIMKSFMSSTVNM